MGRIGPGVFHAREQTGRSKNQNGDVRQLSLSTFDPRPLTPIPRAALMTHPLGA
jgi:hypothetical protein